MAPPKKGAKQAKSLIPKEVPAKSPDLSLPAKHACPSCHSTKTRVLDNLVFCMVCCEAQILRPASGSLTKKKAS